MEICLTNQNNVKQVLKQVDIIKEYILLKFGLDFQEFYNARYKGPKLNKAPPDYSKSNKRSKRKRGKQNPTVNLTDEEDESVTSDPEIPEQGDESEVEFVKQRIKTEVLDNDIPDDLMEFSFEQDDPNDQDDSSFPEQIIPDASSEDEAPAKSSTKKKRKSPKSRKSVKASTSTEGTGEIPVDNNAILTVAETSQGRPLLIHEGFCFRFQKFGKDGIRLWMCLNQRQGKCKARLHTTSDLENQKLVSQRGSHNHKADEISNEIKLINTAIRRDATNSTLESDEIVSKNLHNLSAAAQEALPKIVNIKQKIVKIRKRLAANENTSSD